MEKDGCRYELAWRGKCGETVSERGYCTKHSQEKCIDGNQAIGQCDDANSLVCGYPICSYTDCGHSHIKNQTV